MLFTTTASWEQAKANAAANAKIPAGVWIKRVLGLEETDASGNRRNNDRVETQAEITLVELGEHGGRGRQVRVFLRDVSRGGCGVWSRERLTPGSMVMVVFPSKTDPSGTHRMARVRHCRGADGTGFAVGMSFESR